MGNSIDVDYDYLDYLFVDRNNAINFVKENHEKILNQKIVTVKYSKYVEAYLGNEVPSLFLKNDKKFLKNKPKKGDFTIYRYDENGSIISLTHYSVFDNGKEISDCTYYFFDYQEYKYAVPFFGDTFCFYPSYTFKYKYVNNKIDYVAYIDTFSLWLEIYDWDNKSCKTIYYVPKLVNCDKSVPVGAEKSPASVYLKSLDFGVLHFSKRLYAEWIELFFNSCNYDKDLYIVINENYSSQYTICVFTEKNIACSNEFEFVFKTNWKNLLRSVISITKKIVMDKNINNNVFIGFADSEFFLVNNRKTGDG